MNNTRQLARDNQLLQDDKRKLEAVIEELQQAVNTDPLTGLLNRRALTLMGEQLTAALPPVHRKNERKASLQSVGVMVLDIDHFKTINDTYGHPFGDEVLVALSTLLREQFRSSDSICRWGGEEFLVFLPGIGRREMSVLAQKVREATKTLQWAEHSEFALTVSIGLMWTDTYVSFDELFASADRALLQAKTSGRDQCVSATP